MRDQVVKLLATGFGTGYLPKMPGTAGAGLGVGVWLVLQRAGTPWIWGVFAVAILPAIWVAGAAERLLGQTDPACVVIDEIVGMPVALIGITPVWWLVMIGFVAFRLFDIWKPFPIRQSQKLSGGWGIVVDDLLAGGFACAVTHCVAWGVSRAF